MSPLGETSVTVRSAYIFIAGSLVAGMSIVPILNAICIFMVITTPWVVPLVGANRSVLVGALPGETSFTSGSPASACARREQKTRRLARSIRFIPTSDAKPPPGTTRKRPYRPAAPPVPWGGHGLRGSRGQPRQRTPPGTGGRGARPRLRGVPVARRGRGDARGVPPRGGRDLAPAGPGRGPRR